MTEITSRLSTALAGRYRIEGELGEGGMATVYLAHDVKHERKVALKVLRPELAAAIGAERFLREITTTANLRHPHILPLYDSGHVVDRTSGSEELLFYVMPYVAGETLRDRIDREKQLPVPDAVQITHEVADALSYAHGQGVVHRDVKPENVLLESGHAVLADFGIARALSAAGGERLTETGLSIGTPHYMSPEQAAGEQDIDGRSDLYSLGCMLYEMLAGQPPFVGATVESVIRQHLTADPPSITTHRPSVPANVTDTIARSLIKVPADRFATAAEFDESLSTPDTATVGVPQATPTGLGHRWLLPATAVVVTALIVMSVLRSPGAGSLDDRPTLAVLPFENLGSPENEYFADGITEEMTSRLAEISGISVVSRTSAIRYKETDKNLRQIANELGVAYVLEGTVRTDRTPDGTGQVLVTPQLIRASDDSHLWTERYTANLTPGEIFSVQAEIAGQVASALNVTLLGAERTKLGEAATENADAYDAYLLGRFHWKKRTTDDLQRATAHFEAAIELDPLFAEAHAGLADTYSLYGYYVVPGVSRAEAYARAEAAARRAIELDSTLAAAYASLGNILTYGQWDWSAAADAFERAIALDREYPVAHYWYAELLLLVGEADAAVEHGEWAVELDPASPVARHILGTALLYAGREAESLARESESVELEPDLYFAHSSIAIMLAMRGDTAEAVRAYELAGWPVGLSRLLAKVWVDPVSKVQLTREIARLEREAPVSLVAAPAVAALLYVQSGEIDTAFARLELAYDARSEEFVYNMRHPALAAIWSDPRYLDLMRRMGLEP